MEGVSGSIASGIRIGTKVNNGLVGAVLFIGTSKRIAENITYLSWNDTTKILNVSAMNLSGMPSLTNVNFFGYFSGNTTTTGNNQLGVGPHTLENVTSGIDLTACGSLALWKNTSASRNTAVGGSALAFTTIGGSNTGIGVDALYTNTTGDKCTGIGDNALFNQTVQPASENTALGYQAGYAITTGDHCLFLGSNANASSGTLSYAGAIGAGASVSANNCLAIGAAAGGAAAVDVVIGGTSASARLHLVKTTTQLRLSYDGSNQADFLVGSTGKVTITPNGNALIVSSATANCQIQSISSISGPVVSTVTMQATTSNGLSGECQFLIGDASPYRWAFVASAASKVPFIVSAAAPTNSLVVGTSGEVQMSGNTANGQTLSHESVSELTTIAAAATTDTAIQIPAGAVVLGVSVRVTVVIPTAATFTVTSTTGGTGFNTGTNVSTAANTTDAGTKAGAFYQAAASTIRITPNATPGNNSGRVRVTIHYYKVTPATS